MIATNAKPLSNEIVNALNGWARTNTDPGRMIFMKGTPKGVKKVEVRLNEDYGKEEHTEIETVCVDNGTETQRLHYPNVQEMLAFVRKNG